MGSGVVAKSLRLREIGAGWEIWGADGGAHVLCYLGRYAGIRRRSPQGCRSSFRSFQIQLQTLVADDQSNILGQIE